MPSAPTRRDHRPESLRPLPNRVTSALPCMVRGSTPIITATARTPASSRHKRWVSPCAAPGHLLLPCYFTLHLVLSATGRLGRQPHCCCIHRQQMLQRQRCKCCQLDWSSPVVRADQTTGTAGAANSDSGIRCAKPTDPMTARVHSLALLNVPTCPRTMAISKMQSIVCR
jgi:hypothetical protein